MTMFYITLSKVIPDNRNQSGVTTRYDYLKLQAATNPQARKLAQKKYPKWKVVKVSQYPENDLHYVTRLSGPGRN